MRRLAGVLFVLLFLVACAPVESRQESAEQTLARRTIKSTLWLQTSAEYDALSLQAYATAGRVLPQALADPQWSAIPEAASGAPDRPTAVIMDIDETVLSNALFQGELIARGVAFNREIFREWVESKRSTPLPGALAFVRAARDAGVRVFFVTNRDASLEAATRANLAHYGFPLEQGFDNVLMRNERPGWGRDKASRRAWVARDHRVIMLFGDDLNDFTSAAETGLEERRRAANRNTAFWGQRWFILPNPAYGSWEQALYGFRDDVDADEKLRRQMQHLHDPDTP